MLGKRVFAVFAVLAAIALACGREARAVLPDKRGPTEIVAQENNPEMIELFRVRFDNTQGGAVETTLDAGAAGWRKIGSVLLPAGSLNPNGYTASSWAPEGCIAATAVNAVHVKVRLEKERGVTLSFLPKELYQEPKDYKSYYARNASIITNMPAGTLFFGGRESPFIGNRILVGRGGADAPITQDYSPKEGDVITVVVERPKKYPSEIEFENRFGGFVTIRYPDGESKVVAQVLKPVAGVGRFDGSLFTDVGRIRANHTGVICVSTSPVGVIGGFQILPDNHGMSPEMFNARLLTQWMVIGPANVMDPSLEGVAPFFRYFIRPVYFREGKGAVRTVDEWLQAFIVQVRIKNGGWERMPAVTGRVDDALKDVTHIRILFPLDTDL